MNNRELYKAAFSNLHADHTLDLEALKMNEKEQKNMTGLRCKRGLLVTTLVLIMMLAMTAITYAATDGEVFKTVKFFITGGGDGQVREGTYTVDEDGNYTIDIKEGDQVVAEGDGWSSEVKSGAMKGQMKVNEETGETEVIINEITDEGEPVEGWVPLEDGQELSEEEIAKHFED